MFSIGKNVRKVYIISIFLFLLLPLGNGYSQNLVANPSFELYYSCPTAVSSIGPPTMTEPTVQNWFRPTLGSCDYYNTCYILDPTTPFPIGVPNNFMGYQMPRTGDAYVGGYAIFTGSSTDAEMYKNGREYVEAPLLSPLIPGHRYYAGYWVALGSDELNSCLAFDKMGIYFQEDYYLDLLSYYNIPVIPQIVTPPGQFYSDTLNWQLVSGDFVASGGEDWIIIGNFTPIDTSSYIKIYYPTWIEILGQFLSYYYYDDVCVLDLDGPSLESSYQEKGRCEDDSITVSGRPGYRYLWNDGSSASTKNISTDGIYWVKSIDTAECSGYYVDSFKIITQKSKINLNVGEDTIICPGQPILLNAEDIRFKRYKWNTGDTSAAIEVIQSGSYYINASGSCYWGSDTVHISSYEESILRKINDTIICSGNAALLQYNDEEFVYHWSTAEIGCCITATDSGAYIVEAIDRCGNRQTDSINVIVTNCSDCLLLPNAFTPNNDGLNDIFRPVSRCLLSSYTLRIFNRWGQNVYTSFISDQGWDGTFNGLPVDVGVYFYEIQAQPIVKGAEGVYIKGDITLLR